MDGFVANIHRILCCVLRFVAILLLLHASSLLIVMVPAMAIKKDHFRDGHRRIAQFPFAAGEQLLGNVAGDVLGTVSCPGQGCIGAPYRHKLKLGFLHHLKGIISKKMCQDH